MKTVNFIIVLVVLTLTACGEEYFPEGLYGYQVEHLLASDTSKTWELTSLESNGKAQDPSQDEFRTLWILNVDKSTNAALDSIRIYQLEMDDTLTVGMAKASYYELVFTDSLLFEDGGYWIIQSITSEKFKFSEYEAANKIVRTYQLAE